MMLSAGRRVAGDAGAVTALPRLLLAHLAQGHAAAIPITEPEQRTTSSRSDSSPSQHPPATPGWRNLAGPTSPPPARAHAWHAWPHRQAPAPAFHARAISTSASAHAGAAGGAAGGGGGLTPLEVLGLVASPSQLGASALELVHTSTALPWWASIPATALAARAALLPLSLRARRAAGRLLLLHTALQQAKLLTLKLGAADSQVLRRQRIVRALYQSLQQRAGLPGLSWYAANALAQAVVLGTFSSALGGMSAALWPGLATEGPVALRDLTSPPVFLGTLSTPFGTMGAVVPLVLLLTYVRGVDTSTAGQVPGLNVALRVLALPLYVVSLLQPHATLLYWLVHTTATCLVHGLPGGATAPPTTTTTSQGVVDADLAVSVAARFAAARPETKDSLRAAALCYDVAAHELQRAVAGGAAAAVEGAPAGAGAAEAEAAQGDGDAVDEGLEGRVALLASVQRALGEVLARSAAAGWPQEPLLHAQGKGAPPL